MPRYRNQAFQIDAFQNDGFQVGTPVVGGKQPLTEAQRRWLEYQRGLVQEEMQRFEDAQFLARVEETRKRFQNDEWEREAVRNIVRIKDVRPKGIDALLRPSKSRGVPYNDDLTDVEWPEDSFDHEIKALLKSASKVSPIRRKPSNSKPIGVEEAIDAVRADRAYSAGGVTWLRSKMPGGISRTSRPRRMRVWVTSGATSQM
jgi:hypothetical protein